MPDYELRVRGRRIGERFTSDVHPGDEPLVIALLRSTAKRLRVDPKQAELVTWTGPHRTQRTFRAP